MIVERFHWWWVEHELVGDKIGGRASSQAIIQEIKDKSVDDMVSVELHSQRDRIDRIGCGG